MNKEFENEELLIVYDVDTEKEYLLDKRNNEFTTINYSDKNNVISEVFELMNLKLSIETYQEIKSWYLFCNTLDEDVYKEIVGYLELNILAIKNNYKYYDIVEDNYNGKNNLMLVAYEDEDEEFEIEHFEICLEDEELEIK